MRYTDAAVGDMAKRAVVIDLRPGHGGRAMTDAAGGSRSLRASVVVRCHGPERISDIVRVLARQRGLNHLREVVFVNGDPGSRVAGLASPLPASIEVSEVTLDAETFSYGGSLNRGIERARGDIVLLLSGHSVPADRRWLSAYLAALGQRGVVAACGRQLAYPGTNPLERAYRRVWYNCRATQRLLRVFNASNAGLRRDFWLAQRFDERVAGLEDRLWAEAWQGRGYRIAHACEARAYHSHPARVGDTVRYLAWLTRLYREVVVAARPVM